MKTNNQTTKATTQQNDFYIIKADDLVPMEKQKTDTQTHLQELQAERNHIIEHLLQGNNYYTTKDLEQINGTIIQTLSEIATYKTLKFLMSNNSTKGTHT